MRELENTRLKIRDEDITAFEVRIRPTKKQAVDAITSFGDLQRSLADKFDVNKDNVSNVGKSLLKSDIILKTIMISNCNKYDDDDDDDDDDGDDDDDYDDCDIAQT